MGKKLCPRSWKTSGTVFLIRTSQPVNNIYIFRLCRSPIIIHCLRREPRQINFELSFLFDRKRFVSTGSILRFSSKRTNECSTIKALEHVQVEFSLEFQPRAIVEMFLTSPQGTTSQLLYKRPVDAFTSKDRYNRLLITSLHFWGENPTGQWMIFLKSAKSIGTSSYGR